VIALDAPLWIYSLIPFIPYFVGVIGAVSAGFLVYSGLSTNLERRHFRLRMKNGWGESKKGLIDKSRTSKAEQLLNKAKYPLGITAVKVHLFFLLILVLLFLNYIVAPYILLGYTKPMFFITGVIILGVLYPGHTISPIRFLLNRVIEYRQAKKNAELFSLYDMLVSEIEMMINSRSNIYSVLLSLTPYFTELKPELTRLLSDWTTSSNGPADGVERFADSVGSPEARSLSTVLITFDENDRRTLLNSLKGMEELFITSQIENNRRKRKMFLDLVNMPVQIAVYLVSLNFIVIIIMMALGIMGDSTLDF
jgi:hypothetical protein